MSNETLSASQARAALASADEARLKLAAAANCPPWRHAAFGAVLALLVFGPAYPGEIQWTTLAVAFLGLIGIARWDRKTYGVFINGYRKGATRPLTFSLVAFMLALMVAQIMLKDTARPDWVPFAIAAAAFAGGVLASVWWGRIFRREMGVAA